jgi:hypothetical protein
MLSWISGGSPHTPCISEPARPTRHLTVEEFLSVEETASDSGLQRSRAPLQASAVSHKRSAFSKSKKADSRPLMAYSVSQRVNTSAIRCVRHEYVGGTIFAMIGATKRHNRIVTNIFRMLANAADDADCQAYTEAVKLWVSADDFYYPAVMVAREPDVDPLVEHDPCLVVEIVSPKTEATDRREKLLTYRKLAEPPSVPRRRARPEVGRVSLPRRDRRLAARQSSRGREHLPRLPAGYSPLLRGHIPKDRVYLLASPSDGQRLAHQPIMVCVRKAAGRSVAAAGRARSPCRPRREL